MATNKKMDRRSFLYGQIAVASTLGFGGIAYAGQGPSGSLSGIAESFDVHDMPSWRTGTAKQFSSLMDKPFTAMTSTGEMVHLTLVEAEAGFSGASRPSGLLRSESVSLLFKGDLSDGLIEKGHQIFTVWNTELGEVDLLLGAVLRRSGGYDLEAILN